MEQVTNGPTITDNKQEAESHSLVGTFKEKSTRVQEKSSFFKDSKDSTQGKSTLYEDVAREKSSSYNGIAQERSSFSKSVAQGKSPLYKYNDYRSIANIVQEKPIYRDTVQKKATLYKATAQQFGNSFIFSIMEYIRPLTNLFGYFWNNFAPLRWFVYTLLTFCSVPTAIFIGWAVLCFSGVIALAGVGITIAEGFFLFLGMSVFLPVAIILCIVAFVIVVFLTFAWIGLRSSVTVYEYFNKSSNVEIERVTEANKSEDDF
ncbi:hypothetical protein RclHR1_06870010 [Rhizophagus clarus]|uniref:Uncharacterized protein n=1 Tax=Rhizophagus clarus TaxID=94130 RepID=A0A2Z6SK07_9GLOM|nr:hypothetical protein RclHR1_06870010 [Rhizophagus clarus]GES84815.1 hypothetical protein GLOIN_2v1609919 [Rhizophagus clarus]